MQGGGVPRSQKQPLMNQNKILQIFKGIRKLTPKAKQVKIEKYSCILLPATIAKGQLVLIESFRIIHSTDFASVSNQLFWLTNIF